MDFSTYKKALLNKKIASMLFLGFSSGLPLALTAGTLSAWMSVEKIDVKTIGLFALVGAPYTLKFLWAPAMDRFVLPFLGRRRGWMLIAQVALIASISAMAFVSPQSAPLLLGALAVVTSFLSASQDVVIDAYRTDVLGEEERGEGVAVFVAGYRIAMLVSGAAALVLSDHIGWQATYPAMACLMTVGIATTLVCPEPPDRANAPRTIADAAVLPLRDFFSRRSAMVLLLLIVLFKLPDAYAGVMTTPFLIRGMGFSPSDVGLVNKGFGLVAMIAGAMLGGAMMVRLGLFRSLVLFGFLQAGSCLAFSLLAGVGKIYPVMVFAVGVENFCGGMGTSAFVALLMALCNPAYSATQFALLSSLSSLGRVFISPTAGFAVAQFGWVNFFALSALVGAPGLLLLWFLKKNVQELEKNKE